MHVTVYTKPGCHLCDEALLLVDRMIPRYSIELTEVNILEDLAIYEQYKHSFPVVEVTDVQIGRLTSPITESGLADYFIKAYTALSGEPAATGHETAIGRVAKWLGKR